MDLSKLPKLSNSPAPPVESDGPKVTSSDAPLPPNTNKPTANYSSAAGPYVAAEVWISVGLGLLLLCFYPNTVKYTHGKLTGTVPGIYIDPTPGVPLGTKCDYINWLDNAGNFLRKEMYRDRWDFWSDLAISSFSLVLIIDGIVMALARQPRVIAVLLFLTIAATLGNLIYLLKTLDQGFANVSAFAVVIGGYIAMTQWARLKMLSPQGNARA